VFMMMSDQSATGEHIAQPGGVAFDGFILSQLFKFPVNPANTLLVRSSCSQRMTLIVVTGPEE